MQAITANGFEIGEKVGTEMITFLIDNDLYSAYYSKIEIDGKMMLITDASYKTGRVHAMTRKDSRRLAIEKRDEIIANAESCVSQGSK